MSIAKNKPSFPPNGKTHKLTAWEVGNDLAACCDYLGEKEKEALEAGYTEHAKLLRDCRVRISNFFNRNHRESHSFGLGPTKQLEGGKG